MGSPRMARAGMGARRGTRAAMARRTIPYRTRPLGIPLAARGAGRSGAAQPQPSDPSLARPPRRDWSGVRSGFLEVFLTLALTIGFGFAWAAGERLWLGDPPAIEALRSGAPLNPAGRSATGYPAAFPSGR